MLLVLVGASHHEATLEEIAGLGGASDRLARDLVAGSPAINGVIVLATCNRFEVYLDLEAFHVGVEATIAAISRLAGLDHATTTDLLRVTVGEEVVEHVFSVASGLESMVVGEAEVSGQVRQALANATTDGTTTPTLHRLMQHALETSKAVNSTTRLGAAGRSIASVGLDLVEGGFWPVAGRRALLIGTGAYARIVCAELARRGCTDVWVHSPSGRADQFADSHDLSAIAPDDLLDALGRAELVISCSGTPDPVITRSDLLTSRFGLLDPLPILDLALVSDVDASARELPGIDVIDLESIGAHAPNEHAGATLAARDLVARAVAAFEHMEGGRTADAAVMAMRAHVMAIMESEIASARSRCGDEVANEVARSLRRVSNALLHTPSIRAQELARSGELEDYRKAMSTLFGIGIEIGMND